MWIIICTCFFLLLCFFFHSSKQTNDLKTTDTLSHIECEIKRKRDKERKSEREEE